jgi:protein TonB
MTIRRFLGQALLVFFAGLAVAQTVPPAQTDPPAKPMRLRISTRVAEGLKIHDVKAKYPLEARERHIEGDVLLQATIDTQGNMINLKVVQGDPILVGASLDAVKKWRYRPYIYEGKPVEVETSIRIQFHM